MQQATNFDSENEKQKINLNLYDEIYKDAVQIHHQEKTGGQRSFANFERLFTIAESNVNMNEVTDVYLYEGIFSNNAKELTDTMLHAILTIIVASYKSENIDYLEGIILNEKPIKGERAIDFYLKIGKAYPQHEARVLQFISTNYPAFLPKQQDRALHNLTEFFGKSPLAKKIVRESGMVEVVRDQILAEGVPAQNNGQFSDVPLADIASQEPKKAWWKFW